MSIGQGGCAHCARIGKQIVLSGRAESRESKKGSHMESLIGLAVIAAIAWFFYKSGKRTGSRKGYNVGRSRGRWRR